MKKLLCFLTGVLFTISGMYAQENCIGFVSPNLYPGNTTQTITLSFDNVQWSSANHYALRYEFYKKTDPEEDFHLMTDLEMEHDFQNSTFLALFFGSNYYGQFLTVHSAGYFPNGRFEAGSNMRDYSYNYFNKDYLQIGHLRLDLGWRSDRDYTGMSYMLVIKLVTMQGGNDITMWKYNNKIIGGNNATLGGEIIASDTITTIKYLTEAINDTVCYLDAFNGYKHGRVTLTSDTINKVGYKQDPGSSFYSIFPQTVEFGDACNGRIDSIGTVNFFIRNQISFDTVRTGSIFSICNEQCTAGQVVVKFSNGVAPYTITVEKNGDLYRTVNATADATDFLIDSLQVGTYTLTLTDNAGCDTVITGVNIVVMEVPNDLSVELTPSAITCHDGNDGGITSSVSAATGEVVLPITYKWESTDGTNVSDSTREAVTNLAAGTYTLTATDKYGCAATNSVELQNPDAITSKDTIYCCVSELAAGVHYKPTADTVFYAVGEKEVHFTSAKGCDSTVTVTLISFENPTMVFSANEKVCQNNEIEISLSEGDMRDGFYWTYDGGEITSTSDANESITVSWATAGNKTVSANYTQYYEKPTGGIHGCRAVSDTTITIVVNPLPDATVTTKVNDNDSTLDIKACAGDIIILNAAQNDDYAYVWQLNGQNIEDATEASLTITAEENGNYTVILTDTSSAKGTNCQKESENIKVTVYSPTILLTPMVDQTICNYSATTVTVLPKAESNYNEISYTWNNNSSLNEDHIDIPANTLTDTTTYTVVVTATIGECSVSAYDTVVVNVNNPSVSLTPMSDQTICNGNSATLTANVNSDYKGELSYTWKDMEETTAEITVEPDATTTYYLTVTATVGEGNYICIAEAKDTVIVTVNDPKVTLTPMSDQTLCAATGTPTAELSISATAENGSELTYAWTNNKGLTITDANAATATAHPTDTTEFYVVVTATIGECSVEAKDTMVVNVNTPSVTLGQMEDQTVCYEEEGETGAELTAIVSNSRGTLSYDWSSNMNASFAEMEEGLVWADLQDTTTIYLAVTAALDINADMTCRFTAYDTVVVNVNHPGVTLTPMTDQTICKEETTNANLSITATPVNGSTLTYAWTNNKNATFSDATIANPVATLTDTTEFYVEVTATIGDCSFTAYDTVVVNVNAPVIVISIEEPDAICLGSNTDLEVNVNEGESNYEDLSFLWSSGNEDDVETVTPTLTAHEYTVTVTASIGSCSATASASVSVTVNDTVKLSVTNKEQTICANETDITLAVITVENATVEVTNLPDGVTFDGTNTISGRPTAAGNYNIFITATSNQTPACTAKTDTVKLTVNPTVVLTGTADTTFAMCLGTSVASQGLPFSVQNASYTIEGLPAGINYSANGFYGSPTTAGVFHYTVTATSDQTPACDSKTITGTITVKDTVKYTVTDNLIQSLCWETMGDTVKVTNIANATITPTADNLGLLSGTDYVKVFRTENTPVGDNSFTIVLSSDNSCGHTNKTIEGMFTVKDTVKYTLTGDTTFAICVGTEMTPIQINIEGNSFIEDGDITGLPNNVSYNAELGIHGTPNAVGVFHYTVKINNANSDCDGKSFTGTITVNDTVKLAVTGDTTQTKCLGEALTDISFAVENGTGALTWENNAPAGVTQSETGISGTPTEYGTFRYTYNATSTTNCSNSDKTITGTLTINDTIKLDATNTKQEICLGTTITPIEITSANSEVMVSFDNDDNNGLTYQGGVISGTPTAARNIYYTITASSTNNCGDPKVITDTIVVNDTTVTLTVSAPGILSLQHPGEYKYSVCSDASETNDTVTFTTAADMTNYVWNVDGGTIISGENTNAIQAQWATSGQKNITVAYTNEHGCSGTSASTAITVFEAPTFTVAGSDADNRICIDATDTLTITATNPLPGVHYDWAPETGLTSISETKKVLEGDDLTFGDYAYTIVATRSAIRNNGGDKTCQVTNNITITVDTLPSVTLTKTDPLCYNSEDGSAIATTADAVTNYSFIWNNEVNTSYNTGISAIEDEETYTVTVTDNRTGCTVTKDITLVNPDEIELTKSEHVNVMCYGDATGSFKVSATGGTPFTGNTYQYTLNNDGSDNRATDSTFSNLLKGYYTVTVLDKNGCSAEIMDTIKEPSAPLAVSLIDSTDISCNGKNNGQIWVHVVGGTPEHNGGAPYYNYEWEGPTGSNIDNHNNPAHAFGLIAGRYTIHITDALGCSLDTAVTLTEPDELTITSFATDSVKCKEGEDGKITVNVTGGTLPYQYSLDNEEYQDENIFDGLTAGEYTIYVKDAKSCSVSKDTVIYEPAALAVSIDSTDITCYDGENGSIALTVTGGTGAYNYAWTGPNGYTGNAASIETLKAGRYTVQITDANNCSLDTAVTLAQPEELTITVDNYSDITCHGLTNGTITVSSEGGTGDHVYSLNGGTFTGTHQWLYQLGENDYTITVKDDNGCTASTETIHIANPAELIVKHTSTNLSCYDDNSGSITLTVEGGTPNEEEPYYTYLWNDASTLKDREGLAAGTYSVIVQDMNQCKAYDTVKIEQPDQFSIEINEEDNEICAGDSKHFTTTLMVNNEEVPTTEGYTFQWYKAVDNEEYVAITDSTDTHITVTEEATYKIVATQTASNCTQDAEINLDVYDLPTVTITADPNDSICAGATTTLTCSGNAEEYTWVTVGEWGNNASASIGTTEDTYTVTGITPGRYVISVKGEDQHDYVACATTAYDTITVMALPEVSISGKTEVCAGNDDTLTANGAITYVWDENDNITAIEGIDNKVVFNATASIGDGYTIYVTGTDAFGCQNTAEITINVNPLPVADIWVGEQADGDHYAYQGDTHNFCYGTGIFLTNYYNYDDEVNYSYKWFVANGQDEFEEILDGNGVEYETTVEQTGRYVLQVTDNETGCVNTDTVTIIMNTLPEVTVSEDFGASRICADSIFHITITTDATEIEDIDWFIDDAWIDNSGNTTLTTILDGYTRGEEHAISVIVYDGNNCAGESNALKLTVDTLPTAVLSEEYQARRICADSIFHFTVTTATTTIQWMNGTEEINNDNATTYTTNESGLYFVTVTDGNGCSNNSNELEVVADTIPNVIVTPRDEVVVCMQSGMDLRATGAEEYNWTPIDNLAGNTLIETDNGYGFSTGSMEVPGTAGTYRIEVTGTDGHSCSGKDTITIEVRDLQTTAVISLPEEVTLCENGTVGFKVDAEYSNYEWNSDLDNSLTLYADQPDTVTFTATTNGDNGDFDVYVVVTDENGCQADATTTVHVNELPDITITRVNTPLCQGDTITFKTQAGMTDYTWTYTEDNVAYVSVEDSILKVIWSEDVENTIVNVSVNYTNANGCRAAQPAETEEEIYVLPNIVINGGDNIDTVCLGATEIVTVAGGVSYVWNNVVEWEDATADNALYISPANDTILTVIGTDENGCKNYDTLRIYVNDTVKFTLTNAEQQICLGQSIENIVLAYENCTLNLNDLDISGIRVVDDTIMGAPTTANMEEGFIFNIVATSTANPVCGSKTETITIVVNDTVQLAMSAESGDTTQTFCLGQPIEDIAFETNVDLSWDNDNENFGITLEEISIAGTPTQPGVFHYTVYASEDNYCYPKTITGTITVKDTNKLAIISENEEQEICLGAAIEDILLDTANCTLTFEPALSTMNLQFDPATATISGTPETATTQTFTITATPTNVNCYDAKTIELVIKVNDTVALTATGDLDQKICLGESIETVKFTVANGELSIMDGTALDGIQLNSTDSTLTGTPTAATTGHTIKVQATNAACPLTNKTIEVNVVVDTIPAVEITADDATICPNGQQSATLTATAGYATYTWSTDNTEGTSNTVTVTPEDETTYTVTVKNGEGCTASNTFDITLHTLPEIIISGDNEICLGQSTDLTAEIDDDHTALSYEWLSITSESADINLVSVTPVADSTFRVRVVDVNGCYDTAKIDVTVHELPTVGIAPTTDAICQNGTLELSSSNEGSDITYLWKDADDSVFNARVYTFVTDTNTIAGVHKISVQLTDGNGCVNSDTATVTVNLTPILSETHNSVRCYGESTAAIDLTVRNTNSNIIAWTHGEATVPCSESGDINGLEAGEYTVTVTSNDGGLCAATLSVNIEQPATLQAILSAPGNQLCSGEMTLTVTPEGGNEGYTYVWMSDGVSDISTNDNTLTIEGATLTAGTHEYSVRVMDDSNCVATAVIAAGSSDTIWTLTSERIEIHHEINLGPDETYTYEGVTYDTEGQVFEVNAGQGTGGCDSVIINTIHVFGIGMHFAEDPLDVTHSSYRQEYAYRPNRIGDTIETSVSTDNMFYAYVSTAENTWNAARVDMKYEILFNDNPIKNEDYEDMIENFKISSYYEKDNRFYGYAVDSARGEAPATTFYYQIPSNSTAYFFDYFNFPAFNNMPQKVDFRFTQAGTYTIKFYVEERIGGTAGSYWGLYNPFVVHRQQGPIWGGRGDNPTDKNTIAARYMTVIVGEGAGSSPVINGIDEYAESAEPTVSTYPNPARDMLYLNINGMDGLTHITITDAAGKVVAVYDENLLNSENTLNYSVAQFAQGIYFLNVYNNDTVITKKFIISK